MVNPRPAVAVVLMAALALTACGGGSESSSGDGGKKLIIATDLPLQGASKDASDSTNNAIKLYLEQIGNKAGKYTVELKSYDDSTAAKGAWDDATCAKNAADHVANADEVAVMGTYNSGCAKIIAPVLNADPSGPMLMVSHANTNPGLTKKWDAGEPEKYFPTGKRNYARVITTDDYQGEAAAAFLAEKGIKSIYVLNDNQTYGQGVATSLVEGAGKVGIKVLGNEPWDAKQTSYASLFTKIKAMNPGAIYLAGIYDNNGGQLVKDKVSVMGDQKAVPMMAPDGFTGYPELQGLAQAEGLFLSFTGLTVDQLKAAGGEAAKLLDAYKAKYGKELTSSFALYGVTATQVILAGIEKSDGTRKGVTDAVFTGDGVTIPADKSLTGKEVKIDTKSGDLTSQDISILTLTGGKETFLKAQPVG
ncbi:MAG: branched-chain amino acid ABC transporter substrate-binding protein [Kineosporiaceae bacterium]|nr:branched-chain amino acid ABC transporter substrate-binding protein [Kineosporiaceae bacterium]MBK7624984.1 branched-chain amino acid ABC transporter substrate-binding protein [Kineosporiaceae bacterium]MBK8076636.1 branched-chain amino acid ABC transporter substrate-binding protein [Kineosporiaceae bacterium]